MSDDFTPTMEYVREFYAKFQANLYMHSDYDDEAEALAEAEFDRVLAAHDADLSARLAAAEVTIAEARQVLILWKSWAPYAWPNPDDFNRLLNALAYRPVAAHPEPSGD